MDAYEIALSLVNLRATILAAASPFPARSSESIRSTCLATFTFRAFLAALRSLTHLIGEPDVLGRGHGSAFLRLLASSFIREGAPLVAIDPDAGNLRARRAFARAGFAENAVVEAKQGMAVLMVIGGDAL